MKFPQYLRCEFKMGRKGDLTNEDKYLTTSELAK